MIEINPVSEDAVLIRFGEDISAEHLPRVVTMQHLITERLGNLLIDLIPSYTTLLVTYDLNQADYRQIARLLGEVSRVAEAKLENTHSEHKPLGRQITIPVWYDPSVGFDLTTLAERNQLSVEDVIAIHTGKQYQVFAIGFSPGFAFMGRVDDRIATPRHNTPRDAVPPGSVGIADAQTAIYPRQSPGGWQLIGRTPQVMFDPQQPPKQASLLRVGDEVSFQAIDRNTFLELGGVL